ncbi:MAG TPA: tryptophan halogenase family protein [Pseudolabrys sp.]|nr:tryptophan halogenase family protein [Pseudolabrys sp.]
MNDAHLRDIVILGGGSAGWMTATLLAKKIDARATRITLVESAEIGIVGVGEATIPILRNYNDSIGINEFDFVSKTQATFKLGVEFCDWGIQGNKHFHAFSDYGHAIEGVAAHHYWLRLRKAGETRPVDDYSGPYWMARLGKFSPSDPRNLKYLHAYHFDAALFAAYLRDIAQPLGVRRVEGRLLSVERDGESGHIRAIYLADGREVAGDLFIDCTGFASQLLGKALQTPYVDWSHWLLCDRAIAMPSARVGVPNPFTRSTAHAGGWSWNIPLQHRSGNGMVYSSQYWSEDAALETLENNLEGAPFTEPRSFRFTSGHRKSFWSHNCVGVGLASGFLEPLESTGIQLIVGAITRLLELFPDRNFDSVLRDEYNRIATVEMERIRDFIIAHYCLSRRPEPLWAACRDMAIPDSLRHKLDVWRSSGRVVLGEGESYKEPSWIAILLGNDLIPSRYDVLADLLPLEAVSAGMETRRTSMRQAAEALPAHQTYLDRFCKAAEPELPQPVARQL